MVRLMEPFENRTKRSSFRTFDNWMANVRFSNVFGFPIPTVAASVKHICPISPCFA